MICAGAKIVFPVGGNITELRENKMSVVVLERKSIAAIKTGAPRLL